LKGLIFRVVVIVVEIVIVMMFVGEIHEMKGAVINVHTPGEKLAA
jgi:hypothetical protein